MGILWNEVKHFKPDEFVKPELMSDKIVYLLDEFRDGIKKDIVITSSYAEGGHTENSYHYHGMAVDIMIPEMELLEAYLEAERYAFGGLGFYPNWHFKGKKVGGLHIDCRPYIRGARWWHDGNKYLSVDSASLKSLIKKGVL